jgi:hypothetical protein
MYKNFSVSEMKMSEREIIDLLVNEFWRLGYLTVSRRMGTYLPEPETIGKFKVDVVGRQKDKYAVGIILGHEDLNDLNLTEKISFLASRHSKSSKKPVTLLIGVPENYYQNLKENISYLDEAVKKNIKLIRISKNKNATQTENEKHSEILFS